MGDTKAMLIELYGDLGLPKFGETYVHGMSEDAPKFGAIYFT